MFVQFRWPNHCRIFNVNVYQGIKIIQTFVNEKLFPSMAALLNKWLILTAVPLFFYISGKPESSPSPQYCGDWDRQGNTSLTANSGKPVHPFHVSVVELNHNAGDKTFEISCKIFTDDFEKILARNYKTKVDLINPPDKKAMDSLIKKYVTTHLSVKADGRPVQFTYLGFEHDREAVFSYLQVDNIASVKKIEVTNKLMHDLFNDQINIMHITVGGKRQSTKLDYPSTEATFSF